VLEIIRHLIGACHCQHAHLDLTDSVYFLGMFGIWLAAARSGIRRLMRKEHGHGQDC
jgi:hypothetical protein